MAAFSDWQFGGPKSLLLLNPWFSKFGVGWCGVVTGRGVGFPVVGWGLAVVGYGVAQRGGAGCFAMWPPPCGA